MGNLLIYSAAEHFCIWPRALPRCRPRRASHGRKPTQRGRCASLSLLLRNAKANPGNHQVSVKYQTSTGWQNHERTIHSTTGRPDSFHRSIPRRSTLIWEKPGPPRHCREQEYQHSARQ
jgi:hypothetical protein